MTAEPSEASQPAEPDEPSDDLAAWLAGLPKVELHVHLVGSASVPTVLELAQRHPDGGVPTDEAALRHFYAFTDFAHFIEVYIAVDSLVRTAADIESVASGVLADLAAQQVRYVELTVTPDSHLHKGIAPDGVAEALERARARKREAERIERAERDQEHDEREQAAGDPAVVRDHPLTRAGRSAAARGSPRRAGRGSARAAGARARASRARLARGS